MKRLILITCILFAFTAAKAQDLDGKLYAPKFALKTNALYWATTTPNLGMEFVLGQK